MPEPTVEALIARVGRALELAEQVVRTLLDDSPRIDLAALESPPDKVIAETALLLRAVSAVPDSVAPGLAVQAHSVARQLVRHARGLRVQVSVALHPALARDYAIAHQCLSAMGHRDQHFDALLRKAIDAPQSAGRERLPHRELEQAWILSLGGSPMPTDIAARTALGRGIDVLTGSRDDVYALTHATLYATDFGQRAIELPRPVRILSDEADSALAGALDDDDFDLAGELLMQWPMLRMPRSAASWFGMSLLSAVEDEVGLLPSLAIDAGALRAHHGPSRRQFAMATSYHTAYVMGLLCATLVQRYRAMVAAAEATRRPDILRESMMALDQLPQRARWESHFRTLPVSDQETLASFVLDTALRRAVRRMELGVVHRLVLAASAGFVNTPAVEQARGLLDRVQSLKLVRPVPRARAVSSLAGGAHGRRGRRNRETHPDELLN